MKIAGASKKASEGYEEELNQSSQDHSIGYFKGSVIDHDEASFFLWSVINGFLTYLHLLVHFCASCSVEACSRTSIWNENEVYRTFSIFIRHAHSLLSCLKPVA